MVLCTLKTPTTKTERELLNGIFTGRVVKFFKEAPKRRNGQIVHRGGSIMIRVRWSDAPSCHLKYCRNKTDDYDAKTFGECYKILKVTKVSVSTTSGNSLSSIIAV